MAKKVAFSKPKQPSPPAANADGWVNSGQDNGPVKRLTIDVPASLHSRVKSQCAARGLKMADEIRVLLEKNFPQA